MKFKTLKISDAKTRQVTMQIDSEKEIVLMAEPFVTATNTNYEVVVGLPLAVRECSQQKLDDLLLKIREVFGKQYQGDDFAVAIHSKNFEDDVHFHVSYSQVDIDLERLKAEYVDLKWEL